jgi:hypothetical protein
VVFAESCLFNALAAILFRAVRRETPAVCFVAAEPEPSLPQTPAAQSSFLVSDKEQHIASLAASKGKSEYQKAAPACAARPARYRS